MALAAGPAPRAGRRRLGRRAGRACTARRGSGWSPAPSGTPPSTGRCGCSASAPRRSSRWRRTRNGAIDVADLARVLAAGPGRADDRLPAGRQREHRRLRRPAGRLRPRPPARRLGARGRGVRAVGRGQPGDPAPGRRASSSPTRGAATVTSGSTSPTTRLRLLRATATCTARRSSYTAAYLVGSAGVAAGTVGLHRSSRPAGPAGSRSGPRCASWAATGWPSWSTAAARWPAGSPTALAAGGAEVANDVVLNQVLVGFGDDDRTDRVDRRRCSGTAPAGWAARPGGGRRLMRISVSNWSTTEADVDRSVAAILRAAAD